MTMRIPVRTLFTLALLCGAAFAQSGNGTYTPGQYQTFNPNYPMPDPFYFEGRITWELIACPAPAGLTPCIGSQPNNTWEYLQRGIHRQDDLGDTAGAISDYQTSLSMNSLQNNTCQIVTAATLVNGTVPTQLTPPPCMFTVRLRLGYLLRQTNPTQAISLFQEVLRIDPLKLGVNSLIGETYVIQAEQTQDPVAKQAAYQNAIQAYQAELSLSPVTAQTTDLTGDQANNAHVHWALAEIYETLGQNAQAVSELHAYLLATQWHSDVYPWRTALANNKIRVLAAHR